MTALKVRKNLLLDKELVEGAKDIIKAKQKNFSEMVNIFLKAITKDPKLLDIIEKSSQKKDDSFIGCLSGDIGDMNYKDMKKSYTQKLS